MSSWHGQQLKYAFGISGFMTFYGIVGLIVWLIGDRFGYDYTYRIVVIALVEPVGTRVRSHFARGSPSAHAQLLSALGDDALLAQQAAADGQRPLVERLRFVELAPVADAGPGRAAGSAGQR